MHLIQLTETSLCIMLPSCPAIAVYVKNCYSLHSRCITIGGNEIRSCEGTTQGDPIAMAVYAITIIPMILMIVDITSKIDDSPKTATYTDVTAAGKIIQLKNWWKTLCILGPKFGYYPEPSKSWLIVKEKAKQRSFVVFKDTAIKITTEGQHHLGAVIGSSKYKCEYVQNKIDELINKMKVLSLLLYNSIQTQTIIHHENHTWHFRLVKATCQVNNIWIHTSNHRKDTLFWYREEAIITPFKIWGLGIPVFAETSNQEYE